MKDEERYRQITQSLMCEPVRSFKSLYGFISHVLDSVDGPFVRMPVKIDRQIDAQSLINFYAQLTPPIATIDQAIETHMAPIDVVMIAEVLTYAKNALVQAGVVIAPKMH